MQSKRTACAAAFLAAAFATAAAAAPVANPGFGGSLVLPGARTITWKPYKAWPDNSAASARAGH